MTSCLITGLKIADDLLSLIPCLVLKNMGNAINMKSGTPKILLLNGSHDRETGPEHSTFTGITFLEAIVRGCMNCATVGEETYRRIVTHVIYLEGNGAPKVEVARLKEIGIEPIRVIGRKNPRGEGTGMLYDPAPLLQTLTAILGKTKKRVPGQESRRNTIDGSLKLITLSDGSISPSPRSPVSKP